MNTFFTPASFKKALPICIASTTDSRLLYRPYPLADDLAMHPRRGGHTCGSDFPHRAAAPHARYIINPGSVGQPRYGDAASSYLLLDEDTMTVEFRFVIYDVAAAQEKIYNAMLPIALAERLAVGH